MVPQAFKTGTLERQMRKNAKTWILRLCGV